MQKLCLFIGDGSTGIKISLFSIDIFFSPGNMQIVGLIFFYVFQSNTLYMYIYPNDTKHNWEQNSKIMKHNWICILCRIS